MRKSLLLKGYLFAPFRYSTFLSEANRFHWIAELGASYETKVRSFLNGNFVDPKQGKANSKNRWIACDYAGCRQLNEAMA
jgi:hypothetical protein